MTSPAPVPIAAPEPAPSRSRFYRPELDVLRFVAFMVVFTGHSLAIPVHPGLWQSLAIWLDRCTLCGVPLFFLLSSYLLTELLYREKSATGTINIAAFYKRRILRIWPLYFTVLFGLSLLGFWIPTLHLKPGAFFSFVFLLGNVYTYFHGYVQEMLSPLWSISVEEQFYLFWPSLTRAAGRRTLGSLCGAAVLASQVAMAYLCLHHGSLLPQVAVSSFINLQYFALGAICCLALNRKMPALSTPARLALAAAALVCLIASTVLLNSNAPGPLVRAEAMMPGLLIAGVGLSLLLVAVLGVTLPSWMSPFIYLGKISFGLYLLHTICIHFVIWAAQAWFGLEHGHFAMKWLVALPLSALIAHLSYRYLESPFLRLKERFTVIESRGV